MTLSDPAVAHERIRQLALMVEKTSDRTLASPARPDPNVIIYSNTILTYVKYYEHTSATVIDEGLKALLKIIQSNSPSKREVQKLLYRFLSRESVSDQVIKRYLELGRHIAFSMSCELVPSDSTRAFGNSSRRCAREIQTM